jgi:hypothetical protein
MQARKETPGGVTDVVRRETHREVLGTILCGLYREASATAHNNQRTAPQPENDVERRCGF